MKIVAHPSAAAVRRRHVRTGRSSHPPLPSRRPPDPVFQYAAWAAYLNAVVVLISLLLPIGIGVLVAAPPAAVPAPALTLVRLLPVLFNLTLLPIIVALDCLAPQGSDRRHRLVMGVGLSGVLARLLLQGDAQWLWRLLAAGAPDIRSTLLVGAVIQAGASGLIGLWLLLSHGLAWRSGAFGGKLAGLGAMAGVAQLLRLPTAFLPVVTLQTSTLQGAVTADGLQQPWLVVSMVGGLLSMLVEPIWVVALGRQLRVIHAKWHRRNVSKR